MTTPRSFPRALLSALASLALPILLRAADVAVNPLPHFEQKDGRHALYVDGSPFLILGGQCNNSSAWPSSLPGVWSAVERMGANTLEAPVYWEQFEPDPGHYDTSVVDAMLRQAREHHVRLVLLWFATWKNGSSHYVPAWVKANPEICPKIIGKNGLRVDSPSPHSAAALDADSKAFAALMRHLKVADSAHTVILVQVENESGAWNSIRDYSPTAQAIFEQPVLTALLEALGLGSKGGKNWSSVFGTDADEYFQAWSVARFVGQVAAAGKAEYPLPMYTNAALRDPIAPGPAGTYESGGPTDNVLAIWKAGAPSLDALAPDIYLGESVKYRKVLDLYARPDNPLVIPENGGSPAFARMFFAALGKGAVGWAPFGIDRNSDGYVPIAETKPDEEPLAAVALNFHMVGPIMREVARLNYEGRLQVMAEDPHEHAQTLDLGAWKAVVTFGGPAFGFGREPKGNPDSDGRVIVGKLSENEFLVTGHMCRVDFLPSDPASKAQREFLHVEEGTYVNGVFRVARIWNGDQTDWGLNFGAVPVILKVKLGTF